MLDLRARLFGWAFVAERLKFLGMSYKTWGQLAVWAIVALCLFLGQWRGLIIFVVVWIAIRLLLWLARRNGYTTFKPEKLSNDEADKYKPLDLLANDERVAVRGTGQFVSGNVETRLMMATGEFWQVPAGEFVVMLEAAPGRFKYQMVQPKQIESVRLGNLLLGGRNEPSVEISFKSQWLKTDFEFGGGDDKPEQAAAPIQPDRAKKRTIFLSFDEKAAAARVWAHLTAVQ